MDRVRYHDETSRVFSLVVRVLDEWDPDVVEAERSGDILKIIFPDGVQFILNTQSASQQIWLAGASRGWHFDFHPERMAWVCPKSGDELLSTLSGLIGEKLGEPFSW